MLRPALIVLLAGAFLGGCATGPGAPPPSTPYKGAAVWSIASGAGPEPYASSKVSIKLCGPTRS